MTNAVGILGYQGCIEPHEVLLEQLGVSSVRVRSAEELTQIDRLILPGGESTTMLKFLKMHGMIGPIKEFAKTRPVWGICAGAILAAAQVTNPSQESLHLIDITAHRNFYGPQTDSFTTSITIEGLSQPVEAHFIRAPLLSPLPHSAAKSPLRIRAYLEDQPVFFSQGTVWACSFHVELGPDITLHEEFLSL